ncbi:hypothetical protein ABKV19_012540 [Rosa sericea]
MGEEKRGDREIWLLPTRTEKTRGRKKAEREENVLQKRERGIERRWRYQGGNGRDEFCSRISAKTGGS